MTDHVFVHTGRFNAKYEGTCALPSCEKRRVIEIGDVLEYVDDELYHSRCGGRVMRGETEPLCPTCWLYHAGPCA